MNIQARAARCMAPFETRETRYGARVVLACASNHRAHWRETPLPRNRAEGREALIRAYGAREIATGLAILSTHDATAWVWGRVGGDALDLMALTAGLRDGKERAANVALAVAAVAAVTMLDVICAKGLPAEKAIGARRLPTIAIGADLRARFKRCAAQPSALDVAITADNCTLVTKRPLVCDRSASPRFA